METGWLCVAMRLGLSILGVFVLASVLVDGVRAALAIGGGVVLRGAAWLCGVTCRRLCSVLGDRAATLVLRLSAPVSLALVLLAWLIGWQLGTCALGANLPMALPAGLAEVGHVTLVVLFGIHLAGTGAAWRARERGAAPFGDDLAAEDVLAAFLDAGGRDRLDRTMVGWADWLAEVRAAHRSWPVLLHSPPAQPPGWIDAAVVMLDVAALAEALAPNWAPPHTTRVLVVGRDCVRDALVAVGTTPPELPVSLHGREDRAFEDTVRLLADAGLQIARDPGDAWADFQSRRTCYAPAASALADRLGHSRLRHAH